MMSLSVITFRVRHSRGEMYIGHVRLCVSLSVPRRILTLLHGPADVTSRNHRGCPIVVHCWADLQSVHGFRYYDNIAPKCQRVLVLALCLVPVVASSYQPVTCCHSVRKFSDSTAVRSH